MSEAALWLGCGLAGAIAFSLTCWRAWRVVPAMLAATVAALALYWIFTVSGDGNGTLYLEAALVTVGSWSLILSGVGAAAGLAYRHAKQRS